MQTIMMFMDHLEIIDLSDLFVKASLFMLLKCCNLQLDFTWERDTWNNLSLIMIISWRLISSFFKKCFISVSWHTTSLYNSIYHSIAKYWMHFLLSYDVWKKYLLKIVWLFFWPFRVKLYIKLHPKKGLHKKMAQFALQKEKNGVITDQVNIFPFQHNNAL